MYFLPFILPSLYAYVRFAQRGQIHRGLQAHPALQVIALQSPEPRNALLFVWALATQDEFYR
jgi:hypothetical protein